MLLDLSEDEALLKAGLDDFVRSALQPASRRVLHQRCELILSVGPTATTGVCWETLQSNRRLDALRRRAGRNGLATTPAI